MENNSFEMAYEDLKAAGKNVIGGWEIQLLYKDDQGKQDVAKAAAEKLVSGPELFYISCCGRVPRALPRIPTLQNRHSFRI